MSTTVTPENIRFVEVLGLREIDLLGFSPGGHVAQELALVRPRLIHRLVNARPRIYPYAGHGFLDQYPEEFADDVNVFRDGGST